MVGCERDSWLGMTNSGAIYVWDATAGVCGCLRWVHGRYGSVGGRGVGAVVFAAGDVLGVLFGQCCGDVGAWWIGVLLACGTVGAEIIGCWHVDWRYGGVAWGGICGQGWGHEENVCGMLGWHG